MTAPRPLRPRRSDEELRAASKHLVFEFGMLQQTCESARVEDVRARKNAFLESFAIHARNLLDFFYSPDGPRKYPQPDDVIAEDFFDVASDWHNERPTKSDILASLHRRVNKEVAHLTYERLKNMTVGPSWPNSRITNEFREVILSFRKLAPACRLGEEFRRFFDAPTESAGAGQRSAS